MAHTDARPLGGFNLTALALEVRRVLRNRRTLLFVLVFPSVFFLMMRGAVGRRSDNGGLALAYLLVSMAVYGAMVGTTAGGAAVAVERSAGWSRQMRLTPLKPIAYIAMKVLTALVLGLVAVLAAFVFGALEGVRMTPQAWLLTALGAWSSSLVFAAFGLFMGFLVPSENVMQFLGPLLAILAMFGGLFVPLQFMPPFIQSAAKFSPMYGVGQLAHAPLVGGITAAGLGGAIAWAVVFTLGAAFLFRRDTARV